MSNSYLAYTIVGKTFLIEIVAEENSLILIIIVRHNSGVKKVTPEYPFFILQTIGGSQVLFIGNNEMVRQSTSLALA